MPNKYKAANSTKGLKIPVVLLSHLGIDLSISQVRFNCVGCGICEGICPVKAVHIAEVGRRGHKPFINRNLCTDCGLCLKVCPVKDITVPDNFSKIKKVYSARSKDTNIYLNSASGGGVSSLLIYMFSEGLIDAALVVFYDTNLNLYGDFITNTNEVLEHSGSFYQPSKQLVNINKIKSFRSVAIVGLPCHIEALQKYVKLFDQKNIFVTISLFCTIGRMSRGLADFVKQKFRQNLGSMEVLEYISRFGKTRYGNFILKTKKGETLTYGFLEYLRFVDHFYTPEGCFNCRKLFSLNADISVGDDWGTKTNRKICLISINTTKGKDIFSKCNILECKESKNIPEILIKSQPSGTPFKVYPPLFKAPALKLVKIAGRLNTLPAIGRIAHIFKAFVLFCIVHSAKIKKD